MPDKLLSTAGRDGVRRTAQWSTTLIVLGFFAYLSFVSWNERDVSQSNPHIHPKPYYDELRSKCASINTPAGPPKGYTSSSRLLEGSDRWVPGTPPTLLRNAKIWTGARNGTEVVFGDILLDKGLVVAVGYIPPSLISAAFKSGAVREYDVGGQWVTPGLVDLHSHIGVYSSPALSGVHLKATNERFRD